MCDRTSRLPHAQAFVEPGNFSTWAVLFFALSYFACEPDFKTNNKPIPLLNIDNGRFEVQAVVDDSTNRNTSARGSGSLSFTYSGDISGTFSVSGPLVLNQTENDAVGAVVERHENPVSGNPAEGFSLVGFHPTNNGKADIFVLGTKLDALLSPVKAGDLFGIGPSAPFNGLFLNGVAIAEFWAGQKNLVDASERAFVLTAGFIRFDSRDSTRLVGSFSATTNP